jgi:hypothetical protein
VEGPKTLTIQPNERVIYGPKQMLQLPPQHFCQITNPLIRNSNAPVLDSKGQPTLRHGETEIRVRLSLEHRLEKQHISRESHLLEMEEPFSLYPGEELSSAIKVCRFHKIQIIL